MAVQKCTDRGRTKMAVQSCKNALKMGNFGKKVTYYVIYVKKSDVNGRTKMCENWHYWPYFNLNLVILD